LESSSNTTKIIPDSGKGFGDFYRKGALWFGDIKGSSKLNFFFNICLEKKIEKIEKIEEKIETQKKINK